MRYSGPDGEKVLEIFETIHRVIWIKLSDIILVLRLVASDNVFSFLRLCKAMRVRSF